MVRIIAPVCPHCGGVDTLTIIEMSAEFNAKRLDSIDINLAQWYVYFECSLCGNPVRKAVNDVKAPLGRPAV